MTNRLSIQQKPRVFVGSSSEAKPIAQALIKELSKVARMVPWWESPEFKPMRSILSGLLDAVDRGVSAYDFSLFILAPDDVVRSRGKESSTPRDNVLFELGLFLGSFGPTRTFAVIQVEAKASRKVKVPSDFGGIVIPTVSAKNKKELERTVSEAAAQFREFIRDKGPIPLREKLGDLQDLSWDFDWKNKAFTLDIPKEFLRRNEYALRGKKLLLITMVSDDSTNREESKKIAISTSRSIPQIPQGITMRAPDKSGKRNLFASIRAGTEVEGRLFVVPASLAIKRGMVIKDFLRAGAEIAFAVSVDAQPNR